MSRAWRVFLPANRMAGTHAFNISQNVHVADGSVVKLTGVPIGELL